MATKRNSTTAIPTDGKHIRYDRETKDYACYLFGQLIGHAPNYSDAETLCDRTYREQLEDGLFASATALDGGSSVEEIAADYAAEPLDIAPVREVPFKSEPDEVDGSVITGMSYFAGSGDAEVECFFDAERGPYDQPTVYMFGRDGVDLELVLRALPALQAIANDPRVQAHRAAYHRITAMRMVDACTAEIRQLVAA